MKLTTRLAAGALMVALVAVPATAEAKPASSKVRSYAVSADKSIDRVVSNVRRNKDNAAARELRKVRRGLRGAERGARQLRSSATDSAAAAKRYGNAVRLVGVVSNECADSLSGVVDDAAGDPQVAIAKAIKACIITRERVVEVLTALLDEVPEAAKPYLAKVIAMLSSDGEDEVAGITSALGDTGLPTDVASILTDALEIATAAINDAIGRLQGIVGMLPAPAQPIVQMALGIVTDSLHMVTSLITDLFTGLFGGTPTPGSGTGTGTGTGGSLLGGLFGSGGLPGLNVLQGMFGNGFPFSLIPIDLPVKVPGFGFATR